MKTTRSTPVALTVAGSDSGGGAGIQADLAVFRALGVFGTSAITCLTAQNPSRVSAVLPVPPRMVAGQIDRVLEAFPVGAAKTGMLYDAAIIETVADRLRRWRLRRVVVDPVMVATSGAALLKKDAVAALQRRLIPLALVITPNWAEAEVLSGRHLRTIADQREAAARLADRFGVAVLVKGGHSPDATQAVDVLFDGTDFREFRAPLARRVRLHGAGCTLSAAIAAHLALGDDLVDAVRHAKQFITRAIRHSVMVGKYRTLKI